MSRSFRQLEHTADLALELRADSEAELLLAGMEAVVEILTAGATVRGKDERSIELQAVDGADRLVRWLNEILYMASVEAFIPSEGSVDLHDGGVRAVLKGTADARELLRTEIKSATYHDLRLEQTAEGWLARIVLDV